MGRPEGLMRRREASINDVAIAAAPACSASPLRGPRALDPPGLGELEP